MNPKKAREVFNSFHLPDGSSEILLRFAISEDGSAVESFSVSQRSVIKGKLREIIRYDCSGREGVNVHKFYLNPPQKEYLNRPMDYDTVIELFDRISKNWHMYKAE